MSTNTAVWHATYSYDFQSHRGELFAVMTKSQVLLAITIEAHLKKKKKKFCPIKLDVPRASSLALWFPLKCLLFVDEPAQHFVVGMTFFTSRKQKVNRSEQDLCTLCTRLCPRNVMVRIAIFVQMQKCIDVFFSVCNCVDSQRQRKKSFL